MATIPLQAPGPGPTDQALPDYLSYSAIATVVQPYTSSQTRVVYNPQGGFAPYQTVDVVQGTTTSVAYTIVDVPQLYTGPFPAPPLGSLYTTPGQVLPSATATETASASASQTATATATASASATASNSDAASSSKSQSSAVTAAPTVAPSASAVPSISASDGATASDASVASVASAASASAASASSSTAAPSSTFAASTTSPYTSSSTGSAEPSATAASLPNAHNDLSGGQIAGIVIGSILGLILLLLLLLCCLRRRRKQSQGGALATAGTGAGGAAAVGAAGPRSKLAGSFTRGRARGNYAAVGAGAAGVAGAGAAAAAAAGRRGSLDSDEWEEDNLYGSGGLGFFVVGGKRQSSPRKPSLIGRRSAAVDPTSAAAGYGSGGEPSYSMANATPSSANGGRSASGSKAGLASLGLGAGLLAAAFGRKKDKGKQRASRDVDEAWDVDEAGQPLSDEEGETAERRGLMNFMADPAAARGEGGREGESGPEMREVTKGPASSWIPDSSSTSVRPGFGAAALGAGAAGAYAATSTRDGQGSSGNNTVANSLRHTRNTSSGTNSSMLPGSPPRSGTSASGYGRGSTPSPNLGFAVGSASASGSGERGGSNSTSTSGLTASGSGNSLPPPPRAPRERGPVQTLGSLAPSGAPFSSAALGDAWGAAPSAGAGGEDVPRASVETSSSSASGHGGLNPALLGVGGAAALGGLGALAAGHRESGGSTYSRGFYPSGVPLGAPHGSPDIEGHQAGHPSEASGASGGGGGGDDRLGGHLQQSDPERYSRFISSDTPLLGPGFAGEGDQATQGDRDEWDYEASPTLSGYPAAIAGDTLGAGSLAGYQRSCLPTIRSVGEFGERSGSESMLNDDTIRSSEIRSFNTGSAGSHEASGSGSARGPRVPLIYEERQTMGGEALPDYPHTTAQGSIGQVRGQSPTNDSVAGFHTLFNSPSTAPGLAPSLVSIDSHRQQKPGASSSATPAAAERFSADAGRTMEAESEDPFSDTDRGSAGVQRAFSLDQPANERAGLVGGSGDQAYPQDDAAAAGILGGMAAGWRRLTMGQYGWLSGGGGANDREDLDEGRQPSADGSEHNEGSGDSALPTSNVDEADVRSQRASVYSPSALGHSSQGTPATPNHSSREGSGGSGERSQHSTGSDNAATTAGVAGTAAAAAAAATGLGVAGFGRRRQGEPSIGSQSGLSGHSSSQSRRGGYAASVSNSSVSGRLSGSVNTGLDSLSQRANLSWSNTGSSASRSAYGSSRRTGRSGGPSELSLSGASTGAASYSPNGVGVGANLLRGNTSSTRGGESFDEVQTSQASYNPLRRSGESSSVLTDAADVGWDSSEAQSSRATQGANTSGGAEKRKRPRSNSHDGGPRRLSSLREVGEADGPFADPSGTGSAQPLPQPPGGHYPSTSLGDAVMRSVYRQMRPTHAAIAGSVATGRERTVPRSLQPGVSAPAPGALAGSSSAPSLASPSNRGGQGDGSTDGVTAASWRPSPRVASAAQHAIEAQNRASSSSQAEAHGGYGIEEKHTEANDDETAEQGGGGLWPKFLRF